MRLRQRGQEALHFLVKDDFANFRGIMLGLLLGGGSLLMYHINQPSKEECPPADIQHRSKDPVSNPDSSKEQGRPLNDLPDIRNMA